MYGHRLVWIALSSSQNISHHAASKIVSQLATGWMHIAASQGHHNGIDTSTPLCDLTVHCTFIVCRIKLCKQCYAFPYLAI